MEKKFFCTLYPGPRDQDFDPEIMASLMEFDDKYRIWYEVRILQAISLFLNEASWDDAALATDHFIGKISYADYALKKYLDYVKAVPQ
jgi:hypothetical protein